jgi:raffinose/stachyose/melibiose transport system permease protein
VAARLTVRQGAGTRRAGAAPSGASVSPRRRRLESHPVAHGILLVLSAVALAPIVVLGLNSLRSTTAISASPIGVPSVPLWSNFASTWDAAGYSVAFRNSLIVSGSTVVGVCVLSGLAAYGLARLRVPGGNVIILYFLICLTLPAQLFLTPLFIAWVHLHLINNLFGLIVIYWGIYTPFGTLLLRAFFMALPVEFEEAARVDGSNELQVLTRIVAPIAWPAVISLAVIVAVWSWNEFLFALTFLQNTNLQTVAVRYYRFVGLYGFANLSQISAGGVLVCCLPVAFFLVLQRRFVQGLAAGGLKG